jgi:predicted AAA+ superfamily ATPase
MADTPATQLLLYHRLLDGEIGQALAAYLAEPDAVHHVRLARRLWDDAISLRAYLIDGIRYDENAFSRAAEAGTLSPELVAAVRADLRNLSSIARLLPAGGPPVPPFRPATDGLAAQFAGTDAWDELTEPLAGDIRAHGAGQMGRYGAFRWADGRLIGIADPDPVRLEELVGNADAKATLTRNTEQLLQGLPANNLLLYGDRGTGKSSTVKALLQRYRADGLRLLEVGRGDIGNLAAVMRAVRDKAQRFIIFLDDLSFEDAEVAYKSFKATLEGSLERRPQNVAVYATSNRKHLIREQARHVGGGDELHPRDTVEETASLSDRFGMTVIFSSPDQVQYLAIVEQMAAQRQIPVPGEELRRLALQWTMWHNGRSGRTARQFIDDLSGKLGIR